MKQGVKQGGILSTNFCKTYTDPHLNLLRSKRLGFCHGTVYVGGPTVADDLAYLTKFEDKFQLMLYEADGYSGQNRYQIHPVKTEVVSLSNASNEDLKWTFGENVLTLSDKTVHLGLTRAGKKNQK